MTTATKPMKINAHNTAALEAALEAAQARASVRTQDAGDVARDVARAEDALAARGIPAAARVGCRIVTLPAYGTIAASYHGTPEATRVTAERFPSGWFVTEIARVSCPKKNRDELHFSDKAIAAVTATMRAGVRF